MRYVVKVLAFISLIAMGCSDNGIAKGTPECVESLINQIKQQDAWNPPAKVFRYVYRQKNVYYFPSRCCDIPSTLIDENCNTLCAPDGGITGGGDGKCTDFFTNRSGEKLIWKDSRK
jgi:hypothetical protein